MRRNTAKNEVWERHMPRPTQKIFKKSNILISIKNYFFVQFVLIILIFASAYIPSAKSPDAYKARLRARFLLPPPKG